MNIPCLINYIKTGVDIDLLSDLKGRSINLWFLLRSSPKHSLQGGTPSEKMNYHPINYTYIYGYIIPLTMVIIPLTIDIYIYGYIIPLTMVIIPLTRYIYGYIIPLTMVIISLTIYIWLYNPINYGYNPISYRYIDISPYNPWFLWIYWHQRFFFLRRPALRRPSTKRNAPA